MKRLALLIVFGLGLSACGSRETKPAPAELHVEDAIIRLAPIEGRPAAGYFTLIGGPTNDRLERIASPKAAAIELHETTMTGGMMKMSPLTGVDVPADGKVLFKPGGYHAMLFGVDPGVKAGGTLTMRFVFQSGTVIDVEAKAIAAGDTLPTR